jgi:hypothetical protein
VTGMKIVPVEQDRCAKCGYYAFFSKEPLINGRRDNILLGKGEGKTEEYTPEGKLWLNIH